MDYKKYFRQFKTLNEAIEAVRQKLADDDGVNVLTYDELRTFIRIHLPEESTYQKDIMKAVKKCYPNCFMWKAAAGPYSRGGIPDICIVINGIFFGIEVKRPFFGAISELQKKTIQEINDAGGYAGVCIYPEEALSLIYNGIVDRKVVGEIVSDEEFIRRLEANDKP